jgi:hypothetical protein
MAELDENRNKLQEASSCIEVKQAETDKLDKEKNSLELKLKEYVHKNTDLIKLLDESKEKLDALLHAHP